MNKLEYYSCQKDPWGEEELKQLTEEYQANNMTISEIADIHLRTPGSISYKLKNLGLIEHNTLSRGYTEYRTSELYKEIVEKGRIEDAEKAEKRKERAEKKLQKEVSPVRTIAATPINTEFLQLKREVKEIKDDIKKILELMTAVYEFETSQA
jgi:DNA-binding transcriptional regulator GbsR (MarR family)